ncbi:MAG: PHP domain-containing protein [Candidatus Tectomicrobia bacterium]|uniref:PHP domain-containing protein n=1 Tax=Tectimicrobiota bacterium TaxID=2528274 RepID=A0A932CRE8_UNCTE|nr:PHP domain-containing protein [Candidatus Tectomicrobia bacterium]
MRQRLSHGLLLGLLLTSWTWLGMACRSRQPGPSALPAGEGPTTSLAEWGYQDYRGVIHVHTAYSPDSPGLLSEVAEAANHQGLDYVFITNHDTLRGLKEGEEGWYRKTLLLIGSEVSTTSGHCLVLGLQDFWGEARIRGKVSPAKLFELARSQNALTFIAHPTRPDHPWHNWEVPGATGMELYNLGADLNRVVPLVYLQNLFFTAVSFQMDISSMIRKPAGDLALWDNQWAQGRKMIAVGGTDAHARIRILGWTPDSYLHLFGIVQNHLLVKRHFTGELQTDKALVYEALRQGHTYLSFGLWGEPTGFGFWAQAEGRLRGILGDEMAWEPNLRLVVTAPPESPIVLFRDGQRVGAGKGPRWEAKADRPGVYRAEVYKEVGLRNRPWVLSNPISLKPPQPVRASLEPDKPEVPLPRQGDPLP